jgi:hypothetical protein
VRKGTSAIGAAWRALAWLAWLGAGACARPSSERTEASPVTQPPSAAASSSPTPTPTPAPAPAGLADRPPREPALDALAGEAARSTISSLDREPLLRPALADLRDHFEPQAQAGPSDPRGGALARSRRERGPFVLQRASLLGGRLGALVTRQDGSDPIVVVIDRDQLVWSKPRPTAGIVPPALHPTLAPRPDGGAALFVYVAALHLVAARMWAEDGNAFAEIELGQLDACDDLSAAYAPARGWLVACGSSNGARVQRLREDGTTAWARDGVPVGEASGVGPVTLALDTASSFLLLQRARAVGGDRLLAYRYDNEGHPMWDAPLLLRLLPAGPADRIPAKAVREGVVRVDLSAGALEVDSLKGAYDPATSPRSPGTSWSRPSPPLRE